LTNTEFLREAAIAAEAARNAGAPIRPFAAAAHAANESAYGRSRLATQAHNMFGTKATGRHTPFWTGDYVEMPTWEVIDGKRVDIVAKFRAYPSWTESFGDYGDVVARVYPNAASAVTDAGFLAGLFLTGPLRWATDPLAFDKIARILGLNEGAFPHDGLWGEGDRLVLTNLRIAERWVALTQSPAVLRGKFVWRVRGGRIDVRRDG
jgi:flagellum-specific peptidoglycan hydrolase FlgJ